MKFGLDDKILKQFRSVFRNHPEIEDVVIYGSRAKGNYREGSDIDLTLKGKDISSSLCSLVWTELDNLDTPYLVDLSVFHKLDSENLIEHINRAGQSFL